MKRFISPVLQLGLLFWLLNIVKVVLLIDLINITPYILVGFFLIKWIIFDVIFIRYKDYNFSNLYLIAYSVLLIDSLSTLGINLSIHQLISPTYKYELADKDVDEMTERAEMLEKRRNVKMIVSDKDKEDLRSNVVTSYQIEGLVKSFFFELIFNLLFALLFIIPLLSMREKLDTQR
jgi:cobalamin biosynthesis protein CobD/CbiB